MDTSSTAVEGSYSRTDSANQNVWFPVSICWTRKTPVPGSGTPANRSVTGFRNRSPDGPATKLITISSGPTPSDPRTAAAPAGSSTRRLIPTAESTAPGGTRSVTPSSISYVPPFGSMVRSSLPPDPEPGHVRTKLLRRTRTAVPAIVTIRALRTTPQRTPPTRHPAMPPARRRPNCRAVEGPAAGTGRRLTPPCRVAMVGPASHASVSSGDLR